MPISSGEVSSAPSPEPKQTHIEDASELCTDPAGLSSSTSSPTDLDLPTITMDDFGSTLLQRSSIPTRRSSTTPPAVSPAIVPRRKRRTRDEDKSVSGPSVDAYGRYVQH
ncbi:hypothetical protein AAFF_G00345370 [Aldrovandia affinis]|uniref:Uncharacterized protein n=1 Tax=Aldrovandia affinis TaxID=143900 RepID=A0AAD7VZI4_9TELE|nr:hypothetical protein AAFF_G00345370 [Aldrovandia affinis]